jgi:hypothetical protein
MELTLHYNDCIRISTELGNNFIDVSGLEWEMGMRVSGYPYSHYIEVRVKDKRVATFYFRNKGVKKKIDLGWWNDAEVVYSINEVYKGEE